MSSNVGMSRTDTIGKNHTATVGTAYQLTVGKSAAPASGPGCYGTGAPAAASSPGSSIAMDGDTVTITVGAAAFVLKSDGTITLNGKNVTLTGDDHVQVVSERIDLN